MVSCLTPPSHHLDQCWHIMSVLQWYSPESNCTVKAQANILCNELRIILLTLLSRLSEANVLKRTWNSPSRVRWRWPFGCDDRDRVCQYRSQWEVAWSHTGGSNWGFLQQWIIHGTSYRYSMIFSAYIFLLVDVLCVDILWLPINTACKPFFMNIRGLLPPQLKLCLLATCVSMW